MSLIQELKLLRRQTRRFNFKLRARTYVLRLWEQVLCSIFSYPSRCYENDPAPFLTLSNACEELKYFADHFNSYSLSRRIICKVTNSHEDTLLTKRILRLIYTHTKHPEICDFAIAEALAKVFAYRVIDKDEALELPVIENGTITLAPYQVSETFDLWNKMMAFGLTSLQGPPILLFRGTDFNIKRLGGWASLISDFDPDGPGHTIFSRFRPDLIRFASRSKDGIRVLGHSLGGAFASYCAIYEPSLLSRTHASYAFNAPGLEESKVKRWQEIPQPPRFTSFISRGDVISKFGYLFGDVLELSSSWPLSPLLAHQTLFFAQPKCYIHRVDTHRENQTASRRYYTLVQQKTTSLAYRFGLKYLLPNPYR